MKKHFLLSALAICALYACSTPSTSRPADRPEGFVLLTDIVPDAILEIRYYSTYNFVGARIDGYEAPVAIITREAAEALKRVNDDLNQQGYRIKIYDTYRPWTEPYAR